MTTAWNHLPNAAHIDRIIESVRLNPREWAKAWFDVNIPTWSKAKDYAEVEVKHGNIANCAVSTAWNIIQYSAEWGDLNIEYPLWQKELNIPRLETLNTERTAAKVAVMGAIYALVTWPDSKKFLVKSPEKLQNMKDHAVVLLLPAVKAFDLIANPVIPVIIKAWDHLPNAKYINSALKEVVDKTQYWTEGWTTAWAEWPLDKDAFTKSLNTAYSQMSNRNLIWDSLWQECREVLTDKYGRPILNIRTALDVVRHLTCSLALWDSSAKFLTMSEEQLRDHVKNKDPAAILMLPGILAIRST